MKTTWCLALPALLILSSALFAQAIDPAPLYQDYCAVCHGDDGKSHSRQGLVPSPRDFTSPRSAVELTRKRIIDGIEQGVPGTAMSGWKSRLSAQQISALADFIQTHFMLPAATENASRGGRIYAEYCSVCHGDHGQGAIWATGGLSPPPANFTDPKIQQSLSRDHMIDAVTYGRAETAMTGWQSRLSKQEIATVVDYVITTFMLNSEMAMAQANSAHTLTANGHEGHDHTHFDINLPFPDQLLGDFHRGARLYESNCATCHGKEGDGRGPRAYFINPKPRNFLQANSRSTLNRPRLFEAIGKGRLRTEMSAWEKVLTRQQIADVGEYVFNTFIKP